jgi:hypothetical protein
MEYLYVVCSVFVCKTGSVHIQKVKVDEKREQGENNRRVSPNISGWDILVYVLIF